MPRLFAHTGITMGRLGALAGRRLGQHDFAEWLGLIVLAGVTLRVLYTVLLAPWPPPVGSDSWFYHYEGNYLAQGRGFISVSYALIGVTRPSAAHPPLYPLVLAGLAKLGGTGQETQRLAGSVFGAGTIMSIGLLGRRLAGARVGLIAAGMPRFIRCSSLPTAHC